VETLTHSQGTAYPGARPAYPDLRGLIVSSQTVTEDPNVTALRAAMQGLVRLEIVPIYFNPRFTEGVQVYEQIGKRWSKVGPLIFPPDGGTLADTLTLLASMRED
jgi:hypothetical protein